MLVSIHQKLLLRKTLSKYGVNANRLCTQVNSVCETTRKASRKQLAFLVYYCTGKSVMFTLNHPYTKGYKSPLSTLNDFEPKHSF